jgi:hypothetical protein
MAVPEEFNSLVHCESIVSVAATRGQFGNPKMRSTPRWKPVPENWRRTADQENQLRALVNCGLC